MEVVFELCYDGVSGVARFPRSLGLQREAPTRSESYEGVTVVVRVVAGVLRLLQLSRVPCFPGVVGDALKGASLRGLVSPNVGVFGASAAWVLVGVGEVVAGRRGTRACGEYLLLWLLRYGGLGCPTCGGHHVRWVVVVIGVSLSSVLPGVSVVVMPTQPLPRVPVRVLVT